MYLLLPKTFHDKLPNLINKKLLSSILALALTSYLLISLNLLQTLPNLIRRPPTRPTTCRIRHEVENIGKPKCPKPADWVDLDPETPFAPDGPRTFTDGLPLPKVIVFDFDWTLWPYYFDTEVFELPFQANDGRSIKDSSEETYGSAKVFEMWPDVVNIITMANISGIRLGIASLARDTSKDLYLEFLRLVPSNATLLEKVGNETEAVLDAREDVDEVEKHVPMLIDHFDPALIQVFRTWSMRKVQHLKRIKEVSGLRGKDILLIDDDWRQSVVDHLTGTRRGGNHKRFRGPLTWDLIDNGVLMWRTSRELDGEVMTGPVGEEKEVDGVESTEAGKSGEDAIEASPKDPKEEVRKPESNAEPKHPK